MKLKILYYRLRSRPLRNRKFFLKGALRALLVEVGRYAPVSTSPANSCYPARAYALSCRQTQPGHG